MAFHKILQSEAVEKEHLEYSCITNPYAYFLDSLAWESYRQREISPTKIQRMERALKSLDYIECNVGSWTG